MSSPVQCPVKTVGLWVFGVIAGVLGAVPAADAQGPPYTFEKVQFPGATYTDVTGINNSGVMVGTFSVGDGPTRGFRYDGAAYSPVDFPGATHSYALGINALGHIVGTHSFTGIDGPWHSYLLTDGHYVQFDVPGWESDARAINLAGNIVGAYNAGGVMPTHGYVRTYAGGYTLFDHPDAVYTLAWGLNDAGTVSGSFIDAAGVYRGFVYRQGSFSTLSYPGAFLTHAAGINNRNEVVGTQIQQAGAQHGFVLSEGGLRSFVVDFAGTTATTPLAINDAGQVVGTYEGPGCPVGCGFVARPAAQTPLCDQTISLSYAAGTLLMDFTLEGTVPTTWEAWLVIYGFPYQLWSIPLAPMSPPVPVSLPVPGFPAVGLLQGASLLSTTGGGIVCADVDQVDTGESL